MKACPYCGGVKCAVHHIDVYFVRCADCWSCGSSGKTEEVAVTKWDAMPRLTVSKQTPKRDGSSARVNFVSVIVPTTPLQGSCPQYREWRCIRFGGRLIGTEFYNGVQLRGQAIQNFQKLHAEYGVLSYVVRDADTLRVIARASSIKEAKTCCVGSGVLTCPVCKNAMRPEDPTGRFWCEQCCREVYYTWKQLGEIFRRKAGGERESKKESGKQGRVEAAESSAARIRRLLRARRECG